MELHRLGIKFFAADPGSIRLEEFIPLFHGWIQRQAIPGHLLIDVHDYSHMHNGPGILLVAHEGNFSIDSMDGRPGLMYFRKTPMSLAAADQIAAVIQSALDACRLLEKETAVRLKTDVVRVIANDRLEAPNDDATFAKLKPALAAALQQVFPGPTFNLARISTDAKERLTVDCTRT